jgi:hypothetical protein
VSCDVEVVTCSREDYIQKKLLSYEGNFSVRKTSSDYVYCRCDRGRTPSGKSSGDPTKSRANSCKSFVSFSFEQHGHFLGGYLLFFI